MEKEREQLKFVIVGHVDHGKSTLIGRLLYDTNSLPSGKLEEIKKTCEMLGINFEFAHLMDQLREEREKGMTIDTTQTFFTSRKRDYILIDAPGHKEFIKNTITGATQAEAAVIIVAADEGIQEQTKRHAYILSMLEIEQVIVAINKMDLVEYSREKFENVKEEVLSCLTNVGITPCYIIPISAKEGDNVVKVSENMGWYEGKTLLSALDSLQCRVKQTDKPLRYPIQDVYEIDGKRIVVGRVEAGEIKNGDKIVILPEGVKSIVRSIEIFGGSRNTAKAGESIGITLKHDSIPVRRGMIICSPDTLPEVVDEFKASIFSISPKPLKLNENFVLRCATQESECCIKRIIQRIDSSTMEILEKNANELKETEVGEVILKTTLPVVVEKFNYVRELGRFILLNNGKVVAGGIVKEIVRE